MMSNEQNAQEDEVVSEAAGPETEEPAAEAAAVEVEEPAAEVAAVEDSAVEPQSIAEKPAVRRSPIPWWPYLLYSATWLALVVATVVLLMGEQVDVPSVRQDAYPYLVLAGLLLTLLGPLMSVTVWIFVWARTPKTQRGGLFTTAFLRGAVLTFAGVLLWWGSLVAVDALRLGLI